MDLNHPSPPSKLHLKLASCTIWTRYRVGVSMVPCKMPPQSHMLLHTSFPKADLGHTEPHSPPHRFLDQISLVLIFSRPVLLLWCDLHSDSRTSSSYFSPLGLLILCIFSPRPLFAIDMPHLRIKSKIGSAWYASRGRETPTHDPPPEAENLPVLAPVIAPIPAQPLCETTPDLSPLLNPYACKIEWFDTLSNSLGFAPPPPSPPHHPPPPPSPICYSLVTSSAPSIFPSSSSDSPLSPPLRSTCDRCANKAAIMDLLDDLNKGPGEVKSSLLELQIKDSEHWSHVDILMSFLRDL